MTPLASQLVNAGLDGTDLHFGVGGPGVGAGTLAAMGMTYFADDGPADAVGILMSNDRATVEVVLGALAAGAHLVSLPAPGRKADLVEYVGFLDKACRAQRLVEVVASDDVASALHGSGVAVRPHRDLSSRPLASHSPTGFSLVQYSSGSTASPKPVLLDDAALGVNIEAILNAVVPRPGDATVSWLPLGHDMGLIGMLLVTISAMTEGRAEQGRLVLLDPTAFLRRPATWLEAIDHWQATFTAAPDFGYRMASGRPPSRALDLSCLRCAIVGGEIPRAQTLTAFEERFRSSGLLPEAICPAYGMAEVGLAATITSPEERWTSTAVSTGALADGLVVAATPAEPSTELVASGRPLVGYELQVDGVRPATGTISLRSRSIGRDASTGADLADVDGWYRSGDAGFVEDGLLYVCGRTDDYLVAHGRNVYAPAVEASVSQVAGVRQGRVTAVDLSTGQWAVVVESEQVGGLSNNQCDSLRRDVRRAAVRVTTAQPDIVVIVERGTLPLTASGKLQRNKVRTQLLNGALVPAHGGSERA